MPRKVFDKAFKLFGVKLIPEGEQPVKMVSSTLGIHPNNLYRWGQEYEKCAESTFLGHGSALCHAQFEIKKLKKENKILQKQLTLLKKFQVFLKTSRK
ncbi:transposase [Streptococcus castoreus]|uniref:transposase n=2 Tax=Streptococcus castoreus TaxID=254786 RepID=UPI00040F14D6|nr:transposase [Streptococcus castoreus]